MAFKHTSNPDTLKCGSWIRSASWNFGVWQSIRRRSTPPDWTLLTACQCTPSDIWRAGKCPHASGGVQATQALHEQLRRQEFQLSSNPRMLPREFVPQQVHVPCANTPTPPAKRGRGRGSRGGRGASSAGDRRAGKPTKPPGAGRGRGRGRGAAAGGPDGIRAPGAARDEPQALCISPSPDAGSRKHRSTPRGSVFAHALPPAHPPKPFAACSSADAAGAGAGGEDRIDPAAAARSRWMPQVFLVVQQPRKLDVTS